MPGRGDATLRLFRCKTDDTDDSARDGIKACETVFPRNHRYRGETMSAPTNVALAVGLLLGLNSPAFTESSHGKSVQRAPTHKAQRHAPSSASQDQNPGRGCVIDDGGGRVRPCTDAGGGGGGGGGGY
jgi:hypothetical protein